MSKNFYSYGLDANRKAIETLLRYSHKQGLAARQLTVEEMFAAQSLNFTEGLARPANTFVLLFCTPWAHCLSVMA